MGESYAGTYIPWFAEAVANDPTLDLTMKGIGIGNGWTDPATQYMTYPEYDGRPGAVAVDVVVL